MGTQILLFGMPMGMEWVIILGVVLLLFGGTKIPQLAKGLGEGIRNFKTAVKEPEADSNADSGKKQEKEA
ncbi:MAG: twin-arginine translocase TatA/TatE family subunit [Acidobacteriota bacterium]|jgi:sec-independent protein translocase protein TatA|nr:twin-arginine translocase TatA/TatE family subunit [Acidobacteriota bacterium]